MSYVDAGYAVTLVTLLVYAVGLVLRRRRWERVLRIAEAPATESRARRRSASGRERHDHRAEPSPQSSDD